METDKMIRLLHGVKKEYRGKRIGFGETNIVAMCEDIIPKLEQLKAYEDAEEQGLLLRLPVPIGGKVYSTGDGIVKEVRVVSYTTTPIMLELGVVAREMYGGIIGIVGKSIFLTKEEAEQKLAEMKGE